MSSLKKKLIGTHNVEELIQGASTVTLGREIILTPGAKDLLRNRGVSIRYQENGGDDLSRQCTKKEKSDDEMKKQDESRQQVTATVVRLLNEEYGICDPVELREIALRVVEEICIKNNLSVEGEN